MRAEPLEERHEAEATRQAQAMEALRKQAREDGFAQGLEEARKQCRDDLQRLGELRGRLERQVSATIQGWQEPIAEIVLTACRQILGQSALDGEAVCHVVRQALQLAQKEAWVEVRVNAQDMRFLQDTAGEDALPPGLPLVADGTLARGGCVVRFTGGEIDARIERQLGLLAEALKLGLKAGPRDA